MKYQEETGINTKALKKNDLDFLIASSAISQGAVLVSNDKKRSRKNVSLLSILMLKLKPLKSFIGS
jgi:predicted nucleic acid-binding protein